MGISVAQLGVLSTVIGYYLMKQSLNTETQYAVLTISALSCIFYGIILTTITHTWLLIEWADLLALSLTTTALFLIYKFAAVMYQYLSLEKARFPSLVAAAIILFGEMIDESKVFSASYILIFLVILVLTSWLLFKISP